MTRLALTREVSSRLADCELTHLERGPIDRAQARVEHRAYERALERLGCQVRRLPPLDEFPDGVFVEDTAVVLDELAVLTRPGAVSRRGEVDSTAAALAELRPVHRMREPQTLDGGDVLVMGRRVFVGCSSRTNTAGRQALGTILDDHGYRLQEVPLRGALHLKTAVSALDDETVLLDPCCVDAGEFAGFEVIETDPEELWAANALRIGSTLLFPAHHPRTAERLEARGIALHLVEMSELARAEAGVTCCSLILEDRTSGGREQGGRAR